MGLGGISLWQLLILLLIVVLLFGTKRLRSIGSDLSGAIRDFRKGLGGDDDKNGDGNGDGNGDSERLEADPPDSRSNAGDPERERSGER